MDQNRRESGGVGGPILYVKNVNVVKTALLADPDVHRLDPLDHGNAWSIYFWDPEGNRLEFFMDTPWYVNQPHRIAMDFTLPDAEIYRLSEEHVRSDPSFEPVEDWRAKVAKEMAHA